jgi:hypothetical protein
MEFRLPTSEDTQVTIRFSEPEATVVMDLLDLDDIHVDASNLAKKLGIDFYKAFSQLFEENHKKPMTRTQIWLILSFKDEKLKELKKNCSDLQSSASSTDTQVESTDD